MIIKVEGPFTSFSLQVYLHLYGTYMCFHPNRIKIYTLNYLGEKNQPFF